MAEEGARPSQGAPGVAGFSFQPGSKRQSVTLGGWRGTPKTSEISIGLRKCSKCGKALLWCSLSLLFSLIQYKYALMGDTKNFAEIHSFCPSWIFRGWAGPGSLWREPDAIAEGSLVDLGGRLDFDSTPQHVGSKFPDQGSNTCPLHWKCKV